MAEQGQAMAEVAVRRWRSFDSRTKVKRPSFEDRVDDLARGLLKRFEDQPELAGPLIEDYRYVASLIAGQWRPNTE